MNPSFRVRYAEPLVGAFVLLLVAAALVVFFVSGRSREWGEPVHRLALAFPPEGPMGLQANSEVHVMGSEVGRITSIEVDETGAFRGEIEIRGSFVQLLREDSPVLVRRKLGIAGDAYLEIGRGEGTRVPEGGTIQVRRDTEITEVAMEFLTEARAEILPVIRQVNRTLEEYRLLAESLRTTSESLQASLREVETVSRRLAAGEGTVGGLLADRTLLARSEEALAEASVALAEITQILTDVASVAERLPGVFAVVEGQMDQLPGLVLEARSTLRSSDRLMRTLQEHWLLGGSTSAGSLGLPIAPPTWIPGPNLEEEE